MGQQATGTRENGHHGCEVVGLARKTEMGLLLRIRDIVSQDAARHNAARAAHRLVRSRLERADADAFVSDHAPSSPPDRGAPTKAVRAKRQAL